MLLRATLRYLPCLLLLTIIALTGCGGTATQQQQPPPPPPPPPPGLSQIKHIIFLAEENRSFDHYFGKINDYRKKEKLTKKKKSIKSKEETEIKRKEKEYL